jgi:hypothetical protein
MQFTLTYRGHLPATQKGISSVKAQLRREFHPQIRDQLAGRLNGSEHHQHLSTTVAGHGFIAPAHERFRTAVELDVLLLAKAGTKPAGDADNRLKALIDGLTRPANAQQMQDFSGPPDGGPTYCLMDDDRLVRRVSIDTRQWFDATAGAAEALAIVSARIVLGENADMSSPTGSLFLVL